MFDLINHSIITTIPHDEYDYLIVKIDGDGITDIAVFRPSDGNWYIWNSSSDSLSVYRFGLSTDTPSHTIYAP